MFAPVGAAAKEGGPIAVTKVLPGAVNGQPDFFNTLPPSRQAIFLDNARTVPLMFANSPPPVTCEQLGQLKMPVTIARGEDTIPYRKITALFQQPHPKPAVLHEHVLDLHSERSADAREGIDHERDQRPIA